MDKHHAGIISNNCILGLYVSASNLYQIDYSTMKLYCNLLHFIYYSVIYVNSTPK